MKITKFHKFSTFSVKMSFFHRNRENPLFLQEMQKIAKVAPFRAGAEKASGGPGVR